MPSTIPYDPSLILGNVVTKPRLDLIEQIAKLQAPADAAEQNLNSLIILKRSMDRGYRQDHCRPLSYNTQWLFFVLR